MTEPEETLSEKRARAGRARWAGTTSEQRREAATKASRASHARAALARRLLAEYEAANGCDA